MNISFDVYGLTKDEINNIENECRKVKHLDIDENLLDHISNNIKILDRYGLTKEDIQINHDNMRKKIYSLNIIKHEENVMFHFDNLLNMLPKNFGKKWSCGTFKIIEFYLNNCNFLIYCIYWNGYVICPISSYIDNIINSNEYDRAISLQSDYDIFIINLTTKKELWFSGLLPQQLYTFGFTQSKSSPYNLDINKYIEIFNLSNIDTIEPLHIKIVKQWNMITHPFKVLGNVDFNINELPKDIIIKDEIINDNYHAILIIIPTTHTKQNIKQYSDYGLKYYIKEDQCVNNDIKMIITIKSGKFCKNTKYIKIFNIIYIPRFKSYDHKYELYKIVDIEMLEDDI